MKEKWIDEGLLVRKLSLEDCLSDPHRTYEDFELGWDGPEETPGVTIQYFVGGKVLAKLRGHLTRRYWSRVDFDFGLLKMEFGWTWEKECDPILIDREIERMEYSLYPEKFNGKPLPLFLSVNNDSLPPKDHYDKIALAYAEILMGRRNTHQVCSQLSFCNYHGQADASKKLLDWLQRFKSFLDSSGRKDESAIVDFEATEEKSFKGSPSDQQQLLANARQAALVLRYQGVALTDPNSDPKREADSLSYNLVGKNSPTSGLHLYRTWIKTKYNSEYYEHLSSGYVNGTVPKRTITNRIKDLEGVIEYFKDKPLLDRVIADHFLLKSAVDSD